MGEYIARGEILDESGEKWIQEVQLGECEDEDQAAAIVGELIECGVLNAWIWVGLYHLELVQSLRKEET
jgi:hypothetical protein